MEVSRAVHGRAADGVTRLPIDRVFSMKGFGTVVTGTLVSGRIAVDDELVVAPGDRLVKVRGVQVHGRATRSKPSPASGRRSTWAASKWKISARGQALLSPGTFVETRIADAIVEVLPGARPLKHGARVRFHQGTAEIIGRVAVDRAGRAGSRRPGDRRRRARVRAAASRSAGRARRAATATSCARIRRR